MRNNLIFHRGLYRSNPMSVTMFFAAEPGNEGGGICMCQMKTARLRPTSPLVGEDTKSRSWRSQVADFVGEGVGVGSGCCDTPCDFQHLAEAKALALPSRGVALGPASSSGAEDDGIEDVRWRRWETGDEAIVVPVAVVILAPVARICWPLTNCEACRYSGQARA